MTMNKRKRARSGDILEVSTSRGLAYIHYTGRHPRYGDAIRVLPGFFATRPSDFTSLAGSPEAYFTFYPAGVAVSQGVAQIVARVPVSPGQELPSSYRRCGAITREGRVLTWQVWDGTKDVLRWELSEAERHLPIASLWNHEALLHYLTTEWRPEQDIGQIPEQGGSATVQEEPKSSEKTKDDSTSRRIQHFLYFPSAKASSAVEAQLAVQGFKVERHESAEGKSWLVLVEHSAVPGESTLDSVRDALERLAQEHSGEYDGYQTAATPSPRRGLPSGL